MSKKLIVALSAAVISAKMAGASVVPVSDGVLDDLESLIENDNLMGIQSYLIENEELIIGDTPLAISARLILSERSFATDALSYDEARYRGRHSARNYARHQRQVRNRIRAYRKWKRHHIY